ncbi:MAG: neuraminidase (sialidase)-like protein [Acidimicrobiia bacterium]|nr:neuraminidase (sialidase)-like protein [Acidimicrobiia bacterium]
MSCRALPLILLAAALASAQEKPFLDTQLIFPLDKLHNHSSAVVELPGGELFTVWYRGSGERTADDVVIMSSRLRRGAKAWTPPLVIADTPGFPDCNPAAFVDSRRRLWLMWPVILANEWHTALMKYRISSNYADSTKPPRWDISDNMLFVPRNFTDVARRAIEPRLKSATPGTPQETYLKRLWENSGDKYFMRMGWMPRSRPVELPSGRIIVPLYSDGYDFSLMAITDDGGLTWSTSEPLVGAGNIQPSIARKRDGTLVAYMRDNGPAPKRLHVSESKDDGITWSPVRDSEFPNPGSGADIIVLKNGMWALIYNDTERERHSLAISLSDDEGATWKWKRHLELDTRAERRSSFHYPSILQASDGTLHATYSYFINHLPNTEPRKSIKHAHCNLAWLQQTTPQ